VVPCREISLSRLHEETVIRQGEPELKLAVVSLVGPFAADPQCVSVWLDDLLGLEIGPKMFQRWDVDRRELTVAQPRVLGGPVLRGIRLRLAPSRLQSDRSPRRRDRGGCSTCRSCCFASAAVLGAIRAFTALGTRLLDQNLTTPCSDLSTWPEEAEKALIYRPFLLWS
jgi:hypothetical protein